VPALALSGAGVLLVTVTTRRVLAENP